jgi:uncharacterized surface protein with fasciclin (FAS1) repeats
MYDFGGMTDGENCMPNLLEVARQNADLSLAVVLLERAGLADIFMCPGPFTVQLPTNTAVEAVDASLIEFLLEPANMEELRNLMLYHILPGSFPMSALTAGPAETLVPDREVIVSLNPTMFNEASVVTPDIDGCNGYINAIDQVLTFLPTGNGSCARVVRVSLHDDDSRFFYCFAQTYSADCRANC